MSAGATEIRGGGRGAGRSSFGSQGGLLRCFAHSAVPGPGVQGGGWAWRAGKGGCGGGMAPAFFAEELEVYARAKKDPRSVDCYVAKMSVFHCLVCERASDPREYGYGLAALRYPDPIARVCAANPECAEELIPRDMRSEAIERFVVERVDPRHRPFSEAERAHYEDFVENDAPVVRRFAAEGDAEAILERLAEFDPEIGPPEHRRARADLLAAVVEAVEAGALVPFKAAKR